MKKKQKWTVFSVLGLLILLVYAAICIAPFIYMAIIPAAIARLNNSAAFVTFRIGFV